MPGNGKWDLIQRLKGYVTVQQKNIRQQ